MSKPGLSERLYRRLITLYPSVFVEEYGPEMQREFADEYREHRRSGFRGLLRLWLLAAADLATSLPLQHAVEFINDLRFAFRSLRKNPGFGLTVVLTLAIAIASAGTIFAYVNALLLHPFPYYKDVHRLVTIWNANPEKSMMRERTSYPEYRDWMAAASVFEKSACFSESVVPMNDSDSRQEPEMTFMYMVSPGFFSVVGATAAFGRTFSAEEEKHPGASVAVIRHTLWTRRFHSDPAIIGRRIVLLGKPYTIIGVMPRDFRLLNREAEMVVPLLDDPINNVRFVRHFAVLGRLKAGVTLDEAQTQMAAVAANVARAHPESAGWTTRVIPLLTDSIGHVRSFVLVLAGAVLLLLLIAAANCMNLHVLYLVPMRLQSGFRSVRREAA
jgi:putative ABC transport system permease protein